MSREAFLCVVSNHRRILAVVLDGPLLDTEITLGESHVLPDLAVLEMRSPQVHEVGLTDFHVHLPGRRAPARSNGLGIKAKGAG